MSAKDQIKHILASNEIVLFMKGTPQFPQCGFSGMAIKLLKECGVKKLFTYNVLENLEIRNGIKAYANWPTIPQLYVNQEFIGGSDIMIEMKKNGELLGLLSPIVKKLENQKPELL